MKFEFDLRVGDRVIRITDEAASATEFFEKMAFYDTIPKAGPGGEAELTFSFRTPKGFPYYSIECQEVGKEFKFGQPKGEQNKGKLFPKTWEPILHGAERYEEEEPPPAQEPPKASSKKQETRQQQQPQQSKADPVEGINPNNDVDLNKRAKGLVEQNRVSKEKDGRYKVKVNDRVTYDVWRDENGRVRCNCDRFRKWSADDAKFRCEHIWAVKFFTKPESAAA